MPVITVPVAGQYGLILDQQTQELPINAWSRAVNMRFRDGCAERVEGEQAIFDATTVAPYYIDAYQTGSSRYFIHAGIGKVFADDGTTRTDITPAADFTGAIDDRWSGGTLGGVLVMNNNKEAPQFWGGNVANNLAALTAWPALTTAAVVRPFKNYLVALDVTKSGTRYASMVKWSAAAVPGAIPTSWDETDATKDAGEVDLAEEPSQLVDCMPLGDVNIIYKDRAMYGQYPGGSPYIWTFRRLPGDIGALARGCIANTPAGHVVLTAGDVITHSGQGPRSIANARVRKTLFSTIDATHYKRSFVVSNPGRNEVWICYPVAGDTVPTIAEIWNYTDDTWTTRELDNVTYGAVGQISATAAGTWASTTGVWDDSVDAWNTSAYPPTAARLLTTSTDNRISLIDKTGTFNAAAYTSVLERRGLPIGSPGRVKTINAIEPRFDAAAGTLVQIEVGASMDAEQSPIYSAPVTYTVGSTYRAYAFATGKFPAIRFTSLDNQPWRLKSYDIHYTEGGNW